MGSGLLVSLALLTAGCTRLTERPALQGVRTITPPVAFEILHDNPDLLVLDLRSEAAFERSPGHLMRALNVPLSTLDAWSEEAAALTREAMMIYCEPSCLAEAVELLRARGFRYLFLLEGGLDAWRAAGFHSVDGDGTVVPSEAAGES